MLEKYVSFKDLHPTLVDTLSLVESGLVRVNKVFESYQAWEILVLSGVSTYCILRLYDFYKDLDNGKQ